MSEWQPVPTYMQGREVPSWTEFRQDGGMVHFRKVKPVNLSEFLLARIADDDEAARQVQARATDANSPAWIVVGSDNPTGVDYEPARVLAECAAKRRIVELADAAFPPDLDPIAEHHAGNDGPWVGSVTLKLLALPYADRPGYREEWRP